MWLAQIHMNYFVTVQKYLHCLFRKIDKVFAYSFPSLLTQFHDTSKEEIIPSKKNLNLSETVTSVRRRMRLILQI